MDKSSIFLDYNSTHPLDIKILKEIIHIFQEKGNYSSLHSHGRKVNNYINESRNEIKNSLNAKDFDVIFTSSGTESNNLIIKSFKNVFSSSIDHPSVTKITKPKNLIRVDKNGILDIQDLKNKIKNLKENFLVSVSLVNHEIGVIQNIREIAEIVHENGGIIHSDIVQAMGKIFVDLENLKIDIATISGHKIGTPGGIGAVVKRRNIQLIQMIQGGGQESGWRAGTNCVPLIVFLGKAVQKHNREKNFSFLQKMLEEEIKKICPEAEIMGRKAQRVTNTTCVTMPGVPGNLQVMLFDIEGISISAGAACSSGYITKSHILECMGYKKLSSESIRLSWGEETQKIEIEKAIQTWKKIFHNQINKLS